MADTSQWAPPTKQRVEPEARFPSIAEIRAAQNPPSKVCYSVAQNIDNLRMFAPVTGSPTTTSKTSITPSGEVSKTLSWWFSRHSLSEEYEEVADKSSYWAAKAIVATGVQGGVHKSQASNRMQGPILCVCCDLDESEALFGMPMPAYL
jgi:hypothetical protein